MDLPDGITALLSDLERLGFVVEHEHHNAGRNASEIELRRAVRDGVTGVRLYADYGVWEVQTSPPAIGSSRTQPCAL